MKHSMPARLLAAAALAAAAFGTASAANAASNVYFSVGVQGAPAYVEATPVYVQPRPVYVEPRRVYLDPPVYARPCPPRYASSYEAERAWERAEWHRRHWRHHHPDWDRYESRGRDWN